MCTAISSFNDGAPPASAGVPIFSCARTWPTISASLARLAVESGLFPLFEAEHGEVTAVKKIRRQVPVEDYLRPQGRFRHLFREGHEDHATIAAIQAMADANIRRYGLVQEAEA